MNFLKCIVPLFGMFLLMSSNMVEANPDPEAAMDVTAPFGE